MRRGRDTRTFRLDRKVINEIIAGCSHPELMREILKVKTWDLAMRRITLDEFHAFCQTLPCILWQPEDRTARNVNVRIVGEEERVMIKVSRVVWAACQITSEQGTPLEGEEELHHSCDGNGEQTTSFGCCLNPAHLIRGDERTRQELKVARAKYNAVLGRQRATEAHA